MFEELAHEFVAMVLKEGFDPRLAVQLLIALHLAVVDHLVRDGSELFHNQKDL